jgi:glutathione reductase (NADPH)
MADGDGGRGAMLAVKAPAPQIEKLIADQKLPVTIANKNSPTQTVLSGEREEIIKAAESLGAEGFAALGGGVLIGMTEAQACAQLDKVDIYKTLFRPMKATLSGRDTRTFMKLVVDGDTDRVVGCHIVGPDAGEMIQLIGIAVKMKATKADFDATMAVHPTAGEELVTMRQKAVSHVRSKAATAAE